VSITEPLHKLKGLDILDIDNSFFVTSLAREDDDQFAFT
jgi:hypothetical protein